jgi:membrane protein DedA with SNARE-associated domain
MLPSFVSEHFYSLLTLALLIGGIPALLTAIYLAVNGFVDFKILFIIFFATGLVWDIVWYYLGRLASKYEPMFITRRIEKIKEAELYSLLDKHFLKVVFMSRFIYGTNSAVSVVAGVKRVRLLRFVLICAATLVIWFALMSIIGFTISSTLEGFQETIGQVLRVILVCWVVAITLLLVFKKWFSVRHSDKRV